MNVPNVYFSERQFVQIDRIASVSYVFNINSCISSMIRDGPDAHAARINEPKPERTKKINTTLIFFRAVATSRCSTRFQIKFLVHLRIFLVSPQHFSFFFFIIGTLVLNVIIIIAAINFFLLESKLKPYN